MNIRTIVCEAMGLLGWSMLFYIWISAYPVGAIIVDMNSINEYIGELIIISIGLPIMIIIIILDCINYSKRGIRR